MTRIMSDKLHKNPTDCLFTAEETKEVYKGPFCLSIKNCLDFETLLKVACEVDTLLIQNTEQHTCSPLNH